jgi:Fungal specific transcription factor domain
VTSLRHDIGFQSEAERLNRMFPKLVLPLPTHWDMVALDAPLLLLPPKSVCDQSLLDYTAYFAPMYHMLHMQTFSSDCRRFWEPPLDSNGPSWRVMFASQLCLVAVITSQIQSLTHSRRPPFDPFRVCATIEAWLDRLGDKQQRQLSTLQTRALFVLAQRMLAATDLRLWRLSGDLVRSALVLELHKDPLMLDENMPHVQVETRSRLWYTIVGLDVELSTKCCMPSLVQGLRFNCQLPPSNRRPSGDGETRNDSSAESYQLAMAQSLPARLNALKILTEITPDLLDIQQALTLLERQRVAQEKRLPSVEESPGPAEVFQVASLDMLLRRPIILLRTLELQCIKPDSLDFQAIASNGLAQCLAVLSLSETFDPELSESEAISDLRCWNAFHAANGDDVLRAAYCACLYMTSAAEATDFKHVIRRMVDDFIKSSVRNKADLRPILKQVMGLGLVSGLTRDSRDDRKKKFMQTGLDKVLQLCRERHDADEKRPGNQMLDSLQTDTGDDLFMETGFDLDYNPFNWSLEALWEGH